MPILGVRAKDPRDMTTITSDLRSLRIGRDFVDAVTGRAACRGEIQHSREAGDQLRRYPWESTLGIAETERALRLSAKRYGLRVCYFSSQATEGGAS